MSVPERLSDDFRDCIRELVEHHVEFVLVGGYALGRHGFVRATGDIDFFFRQSPENVGRLVAALTAFGAPAHLADATFLLSPDAVLQLGVEPQRIGFLSTIAGVTFDEVDAGSVPAAIDGVEFRVIGLRELRLNKAASGRLKDRQDLERLDELT